MNDIGLLKGVWHKIFEFGFFSWISFPRAPANCMKIFGATLWLSPVSFAGVNDTGDKLSPVSLLPVINYCRCCCYQR
jgi:hypothetical protein